MVNVTLCFSANQALLAAKAGAHVRLALHRPPGRHRPQRMDLIREIRTIYDNYQDLSTDILAPQSAP